VVDSQNFVFFFSKSNSSSCARSNVELKSAVLIQLRTGARLEFKPLFPFSVGHIEPVLAAGSTLCRNSGIRTASTEGRLALSMFLLQQQ
jgi:hypothetical protein